MIRRLFPILSRGVCWILLLALLSVNNAVASSSEINAHSIPYEVINDGVGSNSIIPLPLGYGDLYFHSETASPLISFIPGDNMGCILLGRGGEQQLFISIVPRIGYLNHLGVGTTSQTFVKTLVYLHNATITETYNSLKHFNWPYPETFWYQLYPEYEMYDWLEVDDAHMSYRERSAGPIWAENLGPDENVNGLAYDINPPDWWLEEAYPRVMYNYSDFGFSAFGFQYYDKLQILNNNTVGVETMALYGTDTFSISFEITHHPAYVEFIPLMDHYQHGCEDTIIVSRQGVQYEFNELIPLTKTPSEKNPLPPVTPIQGNPPLFVSPAVAGIVNPIASFVSLVTLSGAVSVVGVSSALLTIVITLTKRPQPIPIRRRSSRRKIPRDQSIHLKKALEMSQQFNKTQFSNENLRFQPRNTSRILKGDDS